MGNITRTETKNKGHLGGSRHFRPTSAVEVILVNISAARISGKIDLAMGEERSYKEVGLSILLGSSGYY